MSKLTNVGGLLLDYGGTLDTGGRHWAHVLWQAYGSVAAPISEALFRQAYVYGERALARRHIIGPNDTFFDLLRKKVEQEAYYLSETAAPWVPTAAQREDIATWAYNYARRHVEASVGVLTALAHRYRLVMVTNFYGNMHAVLADFGVTCFERIVESAVVGVRKPDPAIWRLGVLALGMEPGRVVAVGDSFDKDILPARTVGCQTVWLKGEGWTDEQHDESLPTAIITNIHQLSALL